MDILNFLSWIKGKRVVTSVDSAKTLIPLGLKDERRDDGYLAGVITVSDMQTQIGGVQSVSGLNTDNSDPINPIIQISVDGSTVTGNGTPGNPLVAAGLPSFIEYNNTDKTLWNNGKGNITLNTTFGEGALRVNTTGDANVAFGYQVLSNNTTGFSNVGIGTYTLGTNVSGTDNIAIGTTALYNNTSSRNIAIGRNALQSNTTAPDNTTVGFQSLAANTTGINNTAVGSNALLNNTTSNYNVAIGKNALLNNTIGSENTAVGHNALTANTSVGRYNTAIGGGALLNNTTGETNTAVGNGALYDNATGQSNVSIGYFTRSANFSNSVIIGRSAVATGDNQFVIGSTTYNAGTVTTEVNTSSQVWNVVINGVARKILLA